LAEGKAQVANLGLGGDLSKMIGNLASSLPLRSNEDERGGGRVRGSRLQFRQHPHTANCRYANYTGFVVNIPFRIHLISLSSDYPFSNSKLSKSDLCFIVNRSSGVGMVNLGINTFGFILGIKKLWNCLSGFGNRFVEFPPLVPPLVLV